MINKTRFFSIAKILLLAVLLSGSFFCCRKEVEEVRETEDPLFIGDAVGEVIVVVVAPIAVFGTHQRVDGHCLEEHGNLEMVRDVIGERRTGERIDIVDEEQK